jgi:hypothetical protein
MNCIIFITHNFKKEFIKTLLKIDKHKNVHNYDVIVLFDSKNTYNNVIDSYFHNIKIIKINKIHSSYDNLGHTLYINYFKQNYSSIEKYNYIWLIENDVYYPSNFIDFVETHDVYNYDLLVSEYGTRELTWCWTRTLKGFNQVHNIGVLAVIMRMSSKMLSSLIQHIDVDYFGYLEAILPHICIHHNYTIQQFLPEMCGILTTGRTPLFY